MKTLPADLLIQMVMACLPQTGTGMHFPKDYQPDLATCDLGIPHGTLSLVIEQPTGNCLVKARYHVVGAEDVVTRILGGGDVPTWIEAYLVIDIEGWDDGWAFHCVAEDYLGIQATPTPLTLRQQELGEAVRLKLDELGATLADIDIRLQAMDYTADIAGLTWYLRDIFRLVRVDFVLAVQLGRTVPEIRGSSYESEIVLRLSNRLSDAMKSFLLRELAPKS